MPARSELPISFLLPQALWGSYGGSGYDVRGVKSRSPGIPDSLSQRIVKACQAWHGDKTKLPSSGAFFQLPVFPTELSVTSLSEKSLFSERVKPGVLAVAVRPTGVPDHGGRSNAVWFHALVVEEDVFAAFDDQCLGLWKSGTFLDTFEGAGSDLPRVEVRSEDAAPAPFAPVSQLQADALTKCLEHILLGGDVVVTGLQPDPGVIEHLRLLFIGIPRSLRLQLGINTFGASRRDGGTQDTFAVGAQWSTSPFVPGREHLPQPRRRQPAGTAEAVRDYVRVYRDLILSGDLYGLLNLGRQGVSTGSPSRPGPSSTGGFFRRIFG